MKLIELEIEPCQEGDISLSGGELAKLHAHVAKWEIVEREGVKCLERAFEFPDFAQALAFTNQVGELAEASGHHPAILTEWGKATVTWWTHETQGLHRNDFIMAAKTDAAYTLSEGD
jgi:4a-hydroxytetrahydrobiopterin dehydratase